MKKLIPLLVLLLAGQAWGADVVDTMKTGGTDFFDNWGFQSESLRNQGGHPNLNIGIQGVAGGEFVTIIWVSLSALSNVDSVVFCTLRVEMSGNSQASRDSVHIYRILTHVDSMWTGNNTDANADSGEMAWAVRMETGGASDTLWGTMMCKNSTTDYANRIIGAGNVNVASGTEVKIGIDRTVIDSMYNGDLNNYGLVLFSNTLSDNTRGEFPSVDNGTAADRPFMFVGYDTIQASSSTITVGPTVIGPTVIGP